MTENKDTFLEHRKNQEKSHFDNIDISDPLSSLLTVEINTTELCNRTCVFCPRHDRSVYPNRNLNMSLKTAEEIANNLLIDNYKGTPAATLATYGAGMSYLHLKQYENAITYLDKFNADDILLSALSKGAIGDAFAEIGQLEDAYDYYMKAAATNNNLFSTPKYLFKAAMVGADLGKTKQALALLERIKNEFPQSPEMSMVEVQIGRLETLNH